MGLHSVIYKDGREKIEIEFDTSSLESFFEVNGNNNIISIIENHINPSDVEYICLDEDYSAIDSSGIETDDMVHISKFVDQKNKFFVDKLNGIEIYKCELNIPNKNDDYEVINVIETSSNGSITLLIDIEDFEANIKNIINARNDDFQKIIIEHKSNQRDNINNNESDSNIDDSNVDLDWNEDFDKLLPYELEKFEDEGELEELEDETTLDNENNDTDITGKEKKIIDNFVGF